MTPPTPTELESLHRRISEPLPKIPAKPGDGVYHDDGMVTIVAGGAPRMVMSEYAFERLKGWKK